MKNKTLIAYKEIDLESIFNSAKNKQAEDDAAKERQYQENIKRLLPFVLELANGIAKMHNMGCKKTWHSTTGKEGVLGYHKVNVQEQLDFILKSAETNSDYIFKSNGTVVEIFHGKFRIWLNHGGGHFNAGLHPIYSMLGISKSRGYVTIEGELQYMAERMAALGMTENWD